jgi:hypothetical protein
MLYCEALVATTRILFTDSRLGLYIGRNLFAALDHSQYTPDSRHYNAFSFSPSCDIFDVKDIEILRQVAVLVSGRLGLGEASRFTSGISYPSCPVPPVGVMARSLARSFNLVFSLVMSQDCQAFDHDESLSYILAMMIMEEQVRYDRRCGRREDRKAPTRAFI